MSIKRVSNKLESLINDMQVLVEKRTDYHMERSDEWQESEKGEEHEQKTEMLQDILDELQGLEADLLDLH